MAAQAKAFAADEASSSSLSGSSADDAEAGLLGKQAADAGLNDLTHPEVFFR